MPEFRAGSKPITLKGTTGADVFYGGTADVTFVGNGGMDLYYGGSRKSTVDFSTINGSISVNLSYDGWQNTGAAGFNRFVRIDGFIGTRLPDRVLGSNSDDSLRGEGGDDYIWGGYGSDALFGGEGNDTLEGGTGNDTIAGGNGNDVLRGEIGDDVLKGENGSDRLDGGFGKDIMDGGAGDDILYGGPGSDTIVGGPGRDTVDYSASLRIVMNRKDASGYWYTGDAQGDLLVEIERLILSAFDDEFTAWHEAWEVFGGAGHDKLTGSGGRDYLDGGDGDDVLKGGQENDTLLGGPGKDRIDGGTGTDSLRGGPGADIFVFGAGSSTVAHPDTIGDFERGDRIDLSAIDARPGGADNAFSFIGSRAFSGSGAELAVRARPGGGWLVSADTDGDRQPDFALIVLGPAAPVASDFVL